MDFIVAIYFPCFLVHQKQLAGKIIMLQFGEHLKPFQRIISAGETLWPCVVGAATVVEPIILCFISTFLFCWKLPFDAEEKGVNGLNGTSSPLLLICFLLHPARNTQVKASLGMAASWIAVNKMCAYTCIKDTMSVCCGLGVCPRKQCFYEKWSRSCLNKDIDLLLALALCPRHGSPVCLFCSDFLFCSLKSGDQRWAGLRQPLLSLDHIRWRTQRPHWKGHSQTRRRLVA